MKHFSNSILLSLIFAFTFSSSFCQLTHTIELHLGVTGDLVDPGRQEVHQGDSVIWKVKADENIRSFNILGVGHPFRTNLPNPTNYYYIIRRKVAIDAPAGEWKYRIKYKLRTPGPPRELDPKIAVLPTVYNFTTLLAIAGFIVTLITSIVFFRKWQNAVKRADDRNKIV